MNITIGDNIKRLRREKGITQETLAQVLNISPQSVSKWERYDAYPDIFMLPSIAGYFGVTVDVLLGNDKIVTEQKINQYLEETIRLSTAEDTFEGNRPALDMARKAYEEFPYDYRIIMLYVNMLHVYGTGDHTEEILRLCGLVLRECTEETLLADARSFADGLVSVKDRYEFVNKYIHYRQNWDWFRVYPLSTETGKMLMQHEIADRWWHLNMYIYTYGDFFLEDSGRNITHEERITLIRKCEKIFHAFMEEDDLGEYVFYIGQYNEFLAREYACLGMAEEALEHIGKAVEGWIAHRNLPESYTYTNPLLTHRPYVNPFQENDPTYTYLSRYLHDLETGAMYDFLREDPRFRTCCDRLRA